jgi:hypothetical protein
MDGKPDRHHSGELRRQNAESSARFVSHFVLHFVEPNQESKAEGSSPRNWDGSAGPKLNWPRTGTAISPGFPLQLVSGKRPLDLECNQKTLDNMTGKAQDSQVDRTSCVSLAEVKPK